MSNVALPFLVLPDYAVTGHELLIGPSGSPLVTADDALQGWDYAQTLDVLAHASVNMALASESLDIPLSELRLCAVLHVGTGAGSLPRSSWEFARCSVSGADGAISLAGSIDGSRLSGRMRLDLQILLASPHTSRNPLSPSLPGSRLWSSLLDVLLEDGGDSRFPIELTSFFRTFVGQLHATAPWYVDWSPHALEADFGGTVRVYVNSDLETVKERFVAGDPSTLQAIVADVMTQMISTTLMNEESEELLEHCGEGSVGYHVRFWLDNAFPGHSHGSIRSIMQDRPNVYRATLLALAAMEDPA